MATHTLSQPCRHTLIHTHLHSSCHCRISGSQRYTSIHRSLGCSHRSGHTVGLGSASTHLHLRGRRNVIITTEVCIAFMCSHPCVQVHVCNQAQAGLLPLYVCVSVRVCVHVSESVMRGEQLPADSLNTRAESIIMRVTTQ